MHKLAKVSSQAAARAKPSPGAICQTVKPSLLRRALRSYSSSALILPHEIFETFKPKLVSPSYSFFTTSGEGTRRVITYNPKATLDHLLTAISHREEIGDLLDLLADHRHLLADFKFVVGPCLSKCLTVGHYHAAREILEALVVHAPTPELRRHVDLDQGAYSYSAREANYLLTALLRSHGEDSVLQPSTAALTSLLNYLLFHIVYEPTLFKVNWSTVRLLASRPELLSPAQIKDVLGLLERLKEPKERLFHDPGLLHNIMRVYSLHGMPDEADTWMSAIKESRHLEPTAATFPDIIDTKSRRPPVKVSRDVQLGTTFLSSFPREKLPTVDFESAMAFFDSMRNQDGPHRAIKPPANAAEGQSILATIPQDTQALDIHVWTAIMSVAAADTRRTTSEALLRVLSQLQSDENAPNPNIVTFTVAMSGLNKRGEPDTTLLLFEQEVLPLVVSEDLKLDARSLMPVIEAWSALGSMESAVRVVEFLAKRPGHATEDEPPILPSIKGSAEQLSAEFSSLQGTLQIDAGVINGLIAALAVAGHFDRIWDLYSSMEHVYGVLPDEYTLQVLGRSAITYASREKRSDFPTQADDVLKTPEWSSERGADDHGELRSTTWDGQAPHRAVITIYWTMLRQNHPLKTNPTNRTFMSSLKRLFGSYPSFDADQTPANEEAGEDIVSIPEEQKDKVSWALRSAAMSRWTHALKCQAGPSEYAHLVPTPTNMHVLIVMLGYFQNASRIPAALGYMRHLGIPPQTRTLCLAMWKFEESGAYSGELKKFRGWLVDWLGEENVPDDVQIAAFRGRQWGLRNTP